LRQLLFWKAAVEARPLRHTISDLWYTDTYERQSDGSVQLVVNAFAFPEEPVK